VAVNVAAALADHGARILIVDAAGERSNLVEIAGVRLTGEFTLEDALAGRCKVADAVVAGPGGAKLLAARGRVSERRGDATTGHKELLAALKSLRGAFDLMVIDAGSGLSRMARRLWLRAQLVLLVTTSEDGAVMDAYAAMKRHVVGARDATCENIRLLVNQAESDRGAADAHRRLTNCCQRFLGQGVAALPALPRWADCEDASPCWHPRVWETPNSQFGHAVLWLGRAIEDLLRIEDSRCATEGVGIPTLRESCIPQHASC
jgi:flagellar biosynthesis protein FlhG